MLLIVDLEALVGATKSIRLYQGALAAASLDIGTSGQAMDRIILSSYGVSEPLDGP